jgi:hypothetical protein
MSLDARKTLEKLKGEADRERTSLYLSKSVMEEFKKVCDGISPSRVMEELMRDFVDSYKAKSDQDVKPPLIDKTN